MKKICPKCNYSNNQDAIYCVNCQGDLHTVRPIESEISYTYNTSNMTNSTSYSSVLDDDISTGTWVGVLIGIGIPIINIIVLIVILATSQNRTLKNFAIAQFILIGIVFVLSILFGGFL